MNCVTCGSKLPSGVSACPACGTPASYSSDNSRYSLSLNTGNHYQSLKSGSSTAIHREQNQTNVLGVVAEGSAIDLYVNQQHIVTVFDTTYSAGRIGTAAESTDGSAADVAFSSVMVWTL